MSISDHIVLMKQGVKQQYDKPQRLYDEPANQFVADFLGNPPINNVPGRFSNGRFLPDGCAESVILSRFADIAFDGPVNLAVRAESVIPQDAPGENTLVCDIREAYKLGKDEMALVTCGSTTFRVYLSADYGYKAGDRVYLNLKKRGVHLFSREDGSRLNPAADREE